MKRHIKRRDFITKSAGIGLGFSFTSGSALTLLTSGIGSDSQPVKIPSIRKGEKQLFVDDVMILKSWGVIRRTHAAKKLEHPVLEADMPWEQGEEYEGKRDRRVYIYGTVLRDQNTGKFRMWYNRLNDDYFATSDDGIHWIRPNIGQLGENNMFQLYGFHSPSFILDNIEPDSAKRYKAIGSTKKGYFAAYSGDGLIWNLYPENPVLESGDTITLAQDPGNGEYLAFHKRKDPRVTGRQVFLSFSKNMQDWSYPEPVMVTDEVDHQAARLLKGGTHAEIYNMSAFYYGSQWLGVITLFRRTGEPLIKGPGQSRSEGPIDIQLVHSRDGRKWERCSDRNPVIPLGPYQYDSGSILGVCNSPVIVGDEMWMYYTAMTTTHGGYLPDKVMSIARAAWRIDGMASMRNENSGGIIETVPFNTEGENLYVNADLSKGLLSVEVLNAQGKIIDGFQKDECIKLSLNAVKQQIRWNKQNKLPSVEPIGLRFYLEHGDLYSYTIE